MAASDQHYRNQRLLDIVFAVSSLVMLASIIWMFVEDYNRPFKEEQRAFRDVEAALAQRLAVEQIPGEEDFTLAKIKLDKAREERKANQEQIREIRDKLAKLQPLRERAEAKYQGVKSDVESIASFYNIAREKGDREESDKYERQLADLHADLETVGAERDKIVVQMRAHQARIDEIERPVTQAQSEFKKVTDRFDTQVKQAINKQWGWGDWFRTLPVIDGFASPVKIQQVTNDSIPIDYNFKHVTRFDRCTTCHLGIDRPAYTKENLRALTTVTDEQQKKLEHARKILAERREAVSGLSEASNAPEPDALNLTKVPETKLTESRITEFAAHPRLDLFVGANSKHPLESFGCSSCHYGQGSATDFALSSHTPNDPAERARWQQDHHWESNHYWDFPMLPVRFTEASCLKCHHEVTDLISAENRVEAPKLLRGYNLIRENGCFGCHEIQGAKSGRAIGPDMRLEPYPTLDELSPIERQKIENDQENPPGKLAKVGPSLFRLSEKTNPDWTVKWLRSPRSFRPETKMPHFYGLSNNHPDVLPEEQKGFPAAEMHAITHYLFGSSNAYLKDVAALHQKDDAQARQRDDEKLIALLAKGKDRLTEDEKTELTQIRQRQKLRNERQLVDLAPGYKGDPAKGRELFTERGCLACHSHESTEKPQGTLGGKDFVPAVDSDANFGPSLSQIAAKLGTKPGDKESARTWLTQWIMNPQFHSPRSRMPNTHLTAEQATDVAAWLLAQPPQYMGEDWDELDVPRPELKTLQELAKVYLVRLLTKSDLEQLFEQGRLEPSIVSDLPKDEQEFIGAFAGDKETSLLHYVGKKGVGRLGCYACHDIPGFENAKPIGVGLNEWGKKDAERLAFEDITNFVKAHFYVADKLVGEDGKPLPPVVEDGDKKFPYEKFFYDALSHHQREGYLHQKILDPRSYDYGRIRAWDDRSRMPQFRLARTHNQEGESQEAFQARAWKDEAEAREAVMTFILGLVGEQVPTKMVNHPTGYRQMQVKGRQVLDKYNCAGCHTIRAGVYDFRASPQALEGLDLYDTLAARQTTDSGMYTFPLHRFWTGKNPNMPETLTAHGTEPKLVKKDEAGDVLEDDDPSPYTHAQFRLAEALRFVDGERKLRDIPTFSFVEVPLADLVSDPKQVQSPAALRKALTGKLPYGGHFSDIMVPYLAKKDPKLFALNPFDKDSGQARAALPPPLYGQGERTQPDWLYRFLLDPEPVRRMSVLRMPKFNLSRDEAKALVDYFAAVEKLNNPGSGLQYPHEAVPQKQELNEAFWKAKNSEYLARLKNSKVQDKEGKAQTLFDQRLSAYDAVWMQLAKENESELKAALDKAKEQAESTDKELKSLKEKLAKADACQKAALEKQIQEAEAGQAPARQRVKELEVKVKAAGPEAFKQEYLDHQAYAADAYRLLASRQMCLQCHQIGEFQASNPVTQGPPLALAHERLRPEWLYRWIATPQRHLTYSSVMPVNFPVNKKAEFQHILAGTPPEQVEAIRDVLMNFPRISRLPINQPWNPEQKQIGEQKK